MIEEVLRQISIDNESYSRIINFICFFVGYLHNDSVYFYTESGKPNFGNNPTYRGEKNWKIHNQYFDNDDIKPNVIWCTPDGKAPPPANNNESDLKNVSNTNNPGRGKNQNKIERIRVPNIPIPDIPNVKAKNNDEDVLEMFKKNIWNAKN